MPTDIVMPQMGESIVEGTITKWLKKPGDKIQRDEPLFEISTDKVDAEIPAPASGVLQDIKVAEGTTVQVNTVVGTIASDGEAPAPAIPKAAAHAPEKEAAPAPAPPAPKAEAPSPATTAPPVHEEDEHARSSPLVRKIAREHNVDLSQVDGTGLGGRITKQDILAFIEGQGTGAPSLSRPTLARQGGDVDVAAPLVAPSLSSPSARQGGEVSRPAAIPGDLVPLTNMRKIIAQRMIQSRRTSAHVHPLFHVSLTPLVTVPNPGQFGAVFGLPIINQPNSAIMGVGGITKTPLVITDKDGNDSIAIRSVVHLTLGYDHRLIDGAVADQFMAFVKKTLEGWGEEVGEG